MNILTNIYLHIYIYMYISNDICMCICVYTFNIRFPHSNMYERMPCLITRG